MNLIPLLFGVSFGLIIVPFFLDFLMKQQRQARTRELFPRASDYWTTRVMKLRGRKGGFREFRRHSQSAYLDEYK